MARVTVEDCVEKVPNRFELVMYAAQRSREIGGGSPITVDRDNDKNPVVSLREIAAESVNFDELNEGLITSHQRVVQDPDDTAAEAEALIAADQPAETAQDQAVSGSHLRFEDDPTALDD